MTWVVIVMVAGKFFLSVDMYADKATCEQRVAEIVEAGTQAVCHELPQEAKPK